MHGRPDLIETLWNVKYLAFEYHGRTIRDLIETLWNVKTINANKKISHSINDLIETLWNVKYIPVAKVERVNEI